ncbi:hypothetical protein [Streptomyces sp. NPDC002564]|uniref:hypothetical protein n=1 Tax=Streptomyces sp. NPDC002564 TaxID=3364649 RepID=UPI00367594E3
MTTSRAPAAIDALLAILAAAPKLEGVAVIDGPAATNYTNRRRLYVGWSPGADQAVELQQQFASAGARRRDEMFSVACYAEARAGDKDMAMRRAAVFDIVAVVEECLRGSDAAPEAPTLNGTVLWCEVATGNLVQEQNQDGSLAGLQFTVSCHARI